MIILIIDTWLILTLVVFTSITLLSLWPLDELPPFPGTDKTHHVIAYAFLMFPVALKRHRHWLLIACVFIMYGGLIELIQPYVNRYGEWLDLLANTSGLVLGAITGSSLHHYMKKRLI